MPGKVYRPGNPIVAEADYGPTGLGDFVAQPERWGGRILALELRESGLPAFSFARAGIGEGATAVHGGFFEHLLSHLITPHQAGHVNLGDPGRVDGDHPACGLGLLPRVEGVDQTETGPRHRVIGVGCAAVEGGSHQVEGLVVREPCRPSVPSKRILLLASGSRQ